MRERLARFMQGRYGVDQFSNFIIFMAVVFMAIGLVVRVPVVRAIADLVSGLAIVYGYFRILSINHRKRYEENQRYMKIHDKVKFFLACQKSHMEQRKTHHIYKCPKCRQNIRVPKGKGRIAITCPKCGTEFIKRS